MNWEVYLSPITKSLTVNREFWCPRQSRFPTEYIGNPNTEPTYKYKTLLFLSYIYSNTASLCQKPTASNQPAQHSTPSRCHQAELRQRKAGHPPRPRARVSARLT